MKLKIAVASLLAAASMSAFAADQTVTVNPSAVTYFNAAVDGADGILSDNADVITFSGLASGWYNVYIAISGQNVNFDEAATTLNGKTGVWEAQEGRFAFLGVEALETSPFVLNLAGSIGTFTTPPGYNGSITVTSAVPEPTTYGMLLGGLGLLGFMARRKSKQG